MYVCFLANHSARIFKLTFQQIFEMETIYLCRSVVMVISYINAQVWFIKYETLGFKAYNFITIFTGGSRGVCKIFEGELLVKNKLLKQNHWIF